MRLVVVAIARQGQFNALFAVPSFERRAFTLPPRRVKGDRPLAADDASFVRSRSADSTRKVGDGTTAIAEHDTGLLVNASLAEVRGCGNLRWLRPEHHRRKGDDVDANVEQGTAAQSEVKKSAIGIDARAKTKVSADHQRLANGPSVEPLAHLHHNGQVAGPHGLHQKDAIGAGTGDDGFGLGCIDGKGLLAEHGLAGFETENRIVFVKGMGGGHVHRVDVGIGAEGLVRGVAVGGTVLVGKGVGALLIARTNGDQLPCGNGLEADGEFVGNAARAEDAPADRCGHGCSYD